VYTKTRFDDGKKPTWAIPGSVSSTDSCPSSRPEPVSHRDTDFVAQSWRAKNRPSLEKTGFEVSWVIPGRRWTSCPVATFHSRIKHPLLVANIPESAKQESPWKPGDRTLISLPVPASKSTILSRVSQARSFPSKEKSTPH